MAFFDLKRHKIRTLLTVLLIVVPVALIVALGSYVETTRSSPSMRYGTSQLVLNPDYALAAAEQETPEIRDEHIFGARDNLADHLAMLTEHTGRSFVPITTVDGTTMSSPQQAVGVTNVDPELGTAGRAFLQTGRWPETSTELLVTPHAKHFGLAIGDTINMSQGPKSSVYTIVGTGYGSYGDQPADFIGLLNLEDGDPHAASWLLHPDEACSSALADQLVNMPVSRNIVLGDCGAFSTSKFPSMTANGVLDDMFGTFMGSSILTLGGLLSFLVMPCLLFGFMVSPSFSLSVLAQSDYFNRLDENGALASQRQLIMLIQSLLVGLVGLVLGVGLGVAIVCGYVELMKRPDLNSWNLQVTIAYTLVAACAWTVLLSCCGSALAVSSRQFTDQSRRRSVWRAVQLPTVLLVLLTAVVCFLFSTNGWMVLVETFVVVAVGTLAAGWLVVGLIAGVAWVVARVTGRHAARHTGMLVRTAPQTLIFTALAACTVMIATSLFTNLFSSPGNVAALDGRVTSTVEYISPEENRHGISWRDAQSNVERVIPGIELTPEWSLKSPSEQPLMGAVAGVGDCSQMSTVDLNAVDISPECEILGGSGRGRELMVMRSEDAQQRFDLTEDETDAFHGGAMLWDQREADHDEVAFMPGRVQKAKEGMPLFTPRREYRISMMEVDAPELNGTMVMSLPTAKSFALSMEVGRFSAWHPDRQLDQGDSNRVKNQLRNVYLSNPTSSGPVPARFSTTLGFAALCTIVFFAITLHRRHFGSYLRNLKKLGARRSYVALLPAALAASVCCIGVVMGATFLWLMWLTPGWATYNQFTWGAQTLYYSENKIGPSPDLIMQQLLFLGAAPLLVGAGVFLTTLRHRDPAAETQPTT